MPNTDTFIKTVYRRYNPNNTTANKWEVILFKTSADQVLETETKKVLTATERTKLAGIAEGATNVTTDTVAGWGYAKSADIAEAYQPKDADLTAIAGLSGTSGFLKKTAADSWSLDTTSYVSDARKINTKALSSDITLYASDITLASNDNTTIATAISNIVAVAEGKTKAYVISFTTGTNNASFNTQSDFSIDLNSGEKIHTLDGSDIDLTSLKTGDIIYITQPTVPDRWVNVNTTLNKVWFHVLETTKVPIEDYVLKTTTVNGHALSGNVTVTKGDVGLGNVENTALSTWAGSGNLTTVKKGTLGDACVKGVATSISSSSTDNDLITAKGVYSYVNRAVSETHKITLGTTQPSSPNSGDIWLDTNNAVVVQNS